MSLFVSNSSIGLYGQVSCSSKRYCIYNKQPNEIRLLHQGVTILLLMYHQSTKKLLMVMQVGFYQAMCLQEQALLLHKDLLILHWSYLDFVSMMKYSSERCLYFRAAY